MQRLPLHCIAFTLTFVTMQSSVRIDLDSILALLNVAFLCLVTKTREILPFFNATQGPCIIYMYIICESSLTVTQAYLLQWKCVVYSQLHIHWDISSLACGYYQVQCHVGTLPNMHLFRYKLTRKGLQLAKEMGIPLHEGACVAPEDWKLICSGPGYYEWVTYIHVAWCDWF